MIKKEYIDENGKECDEKEAVAYKTDKFFYILSYCSELYTKQTVLLAKNSARTKFVRVGPKAYASYVKYLNTGLKTYHSLASRNPRD